MRTYKPISTVSFNTESFLWVKLNLLIRDNVIFRYAYIKHHGEEGKDHFHVYVEPNGQIDTHSDYWKNILVEPVPDSEPLNCLPWRRSNFDDWALYSSHNEYYLKVKNLKKQVLNYPKTDFISNEDWFVSAYDSLDITPLLSPMERMLKCYFDGLTPLEAMIELRIPYGCMHSFMKGWQLIKEMENET